MRFLVAWVFFGVGHAACQFVFAIDNTPVPGMIEQDLENWEASPRGRLHGLAFALYQTMMRWSVIIQGDRAGPGLAATDA